MGAGHAERPHDHAQRPHGRPHPHPNAEQAQLDAVLRTVAGKPLRASPAMDVWALGMVMWELFTNEPFFSGCSDDVVLQVLATTARLGLG